MRRKMVKHTALMAFVSICLTAQTIPVFATQDYPVTQGTWRYEQDKWKFYTEDGKPNTGWVHTDSGWYYLDTQDGSLKTGWYLGEDGNRYFFDPTEGQSKGKMLTGWQWIDGYCYFFGSESGKESGKLLTGGKTPDGFLTDAQGRWVSKDGSPQYMQGKGISSVGANTGANKTKSVSESGSSSSGSKKNNTPVTTPQPAPEQKKEEVQELDRGENQEDPADLNLLDEERTRLVNLGWIQYAVVSFRSGTIDEYSIFVDGTDVTEACTNVDDDGSMVKWETTVTNPKSIKAVRNSDQTEQILALGKGSAVQTPEIGSQDSSPYYILTNGPISVFDYNLDVYDKNGDVRREPERTTFDLSGGRLLPSGNVPSNYYAPDVLMNLQTGKGEILVKLALENKKQEEWFEQIQTLKMLNPENNIINGNLPYYTEIENSYGKTGVIRIPLPQDNLRSRGRYQLNILSGASQETLTLPIHLVDDRKFSMQLSTLNMSPKVGEDFAFDIVGVEGETFGTDLRIPIYRVEMTDPSGNVRILEDITDYYEIGPLLHIRGTRTEDDGGEVITSEAGVYTITVYATGYQTMKKKVEIYGVTTAREEVSMKAFALDAISSATLSPGTGGDGSSGGGGNVNGYLLFEHDLVANALILNELAYLNDDAKEVVERWFSQKPIAVMEEDMTAYDFNYYMNAVKDARLEEERSLSFRDYASTGEAPVTAGRPYQVKRVLENGLLGTVMELADLMGKPVPLLKGTDAAPGNDFLIRSEDPDYISQITELYLDGNGTALRNDNYLPEYKIDAGEGILTLYYSALREFDMPVIGKHNLRIKADGYQTARVTLNVTKIMESIELTLNSNPEAEEGEDSTAYFRGQDVYVSASGDSENELYGDFLKNVEKVSLINPAGNSRDLNTYAATGGDQNYRIQNGSIRLGKGLFKETGEYRLIVLSHGYEAKTLTFQINVAEEKPGDHHNSKSVPEFDRAVFVERDYGAPYYEISFRGLAEEEIGEYLNTAGKTISVNGSPYSETKTMFSYPYQKYIVATKDYSGQDGIYLRISADGFKNVEEKENEVEILVPGYDPLTFFVTREKADPEIPDPTELNDPEEEKFTPGFKKATWKNNTGLEYLFGPSYYEISFDGLKDKEIEAYLATEGKTITVNGEEYEFAEDLKSESEKNYTIVADASNKKNHLRLTADGFNETSNTVCIAVEGYEELIFEVEEGKDTVPQKETKKAETRKEEFLIAEIPDEAEGAEPEKEETGKKLPGIDETAEYGKEEAGEEIPDTERTAESGKELSDTEETAKSGKEEAEEEIPEALETGESEEEAGEELPDTEETTESEKEEVGETFSN